MPSQAKLKPPHSDDRVHRAFIYAPINSVDGRLGGRKTSKLRTKGGDRTCKPYSLFAPCRSPTGRSEHRRERFSGLNQPALLSGVLMSGIEFVQSSLAGNASDRGIGHR